MFSELMKHSLPHRDGEGVEQDYNLAYQYFTMSAEQGHASAMVDVGLCYEYGRGVEIDKTEAVKWYKKAADLGDKYGTRLNSSHAT